MRCSLIIKRWLLKLGTTCIQIAAWWIYQAFSMLIAIHFLVMYHFFLFFRVILSQCSLRCCGACSDYQGNTSYSQIICIITFELCSYCLLLLVCWFVLSFKLQGANISDDCLTQRFGSRFEKKLILECIYMWRLILIQDSWIVPRWKWLEGICEGLPCLHEGLSR